MGDETKRDASSLNVALSMKSVFVRKEKHELKVGVFCGFSWSSTYSLICLNTRMNTAVFTFILMIVIFCPTADHPETHTANMLLEELKGIVQSLIKNASDSGREVLVCSSQMNFAQLKICSLFGSAIMCQL